jgi:hypothetical protein
MGEYSFFAVHNGSHFGSFVSLIFGLFLFVTYLTFMVMRRSAFKKSADIGNEHSSDMNDAWSEILGESSSGEKLAALCPNSDQTFEESFKSLLDIPDEDRIDIDSLIRVWETSKTSVLVKQEYTDIKRLFQEAEFCNEAFQVRRSSPCMLHCVCMSH